jgi:hypothetical protein
LILHDEPKSLRDSEALSPSPTDMALPTVI